MSTKRSVPSEAPFPPDSARNVPDVPIRIGLIGFGHVGRALARLLAAKRGQLKALLGREWRTAYDRLSDLITALQDRRADGGPAAGSRLR